MRWIAFMIGLLMLGLLFGCATAPRAPLAVPVPDSPQEYRVILPQWREGMVVTMNAVEFFEIIGGMKGMRIDASEKKHINRLLVTERTADGNLHLRLTRDGVETGRFTLDAKGLLVDATQTNRAGNLAAQLPLHNSIVSQMFSVKTFRRGEPVRVVVPSDLLYPFLPSNWREGLEKTVEMELTFTGYVRLGETIAAALTTKGDLLRASVHLPAKEKGNDMWIDEIRVEFCSYYDPTNGHIVVEHTTFIANGRWGGFPMRTRMIVQETLDRANSLGL